MITTEELTAIRTKADSLTSELAVIIATLPDIKARETAIEATRTALTQERSRLAALHQSLVERERLVAEEKRSVIAEQEKTNGRIIIAAKKEEQIELIKKEWFEKARSFDVREQEILAKEERLKGWETKLATWEKDLQGREQEMKKQIAIDRERKESLSILERQIKADQERVNRYLSQLG